jgi:hypothetical protein
LTNIVVSGRTGTEIVTRDVAVGLLRQGHEPIVYTPKAGPLADRLRSASVPVVDDIAAIRVVPDIIHGHHNVPLATAVARFPKVPAIFVCHDFVAWHDSPPIFPSIRRYVAVDHTVADRLRVESGVPLERVIVRLNAVDLERFPLSDRELPERPKRALAFVKHAQHVDHVARACAARNITLDVAGTMAGKPLEEPEKVLPQYDLVFTSALSALEAMASGCAVIVCDARGLAGFVTPDTFERWRPYNFGLRTLQRPVTVDALVAEIDRYDRAAAANVTALVRRDAGMQDLVDGYIALYEECVAEGVPRARAQHDVALARFVQQWGPRDDARWPWMVERRQLLDDLDAARGLPPRIRLGETVSVVTGHGRADRVSGFSFPEAHGVWTDGDTAVMVVRVDAPAPEVQLEFLTDAFVRADHSRLEVDVFANAARVATWSFEHPSVPSWRRAAVTPSADGVVVLTFAIRTPTSPSALGEGADARALGIALSQLRIAVPEREAPS